MKVLIRNERKMATEFNKYFITMIQILHKKFLSIHHDFKKYLPKVNSKRNFKELSADQFEKAFAPLKRNKANDTDDVNGNVVIDVYNEIKEPLFKVFNFSLREGIFPDALKYAKVKPIFKSGDVSEIGNYRPISVLTFFSKILEKIMYNRVYCYLTKHKLLFNKQFWFSKKQNNSTEHALLELSDKILKSFEMGESMLGVFIDLSKAFDTINHSILLDNLNYYGISGIYFSWLSKTKKTVYF